MSTIAQFDPPAGLTDFDQIPHQLAAWSEFISNSFDGNIGAVAQKLGAAGQCQFYNPQKTDTVEPSAQKEIQWRGFPLLIAQKHPGNRKAAFREADQLLPGGERPQDEYLEWFVARDGNGKITRVTFSCEGPEYWEAMAHGYPIDYDGPKIAGGTGDKQRVLALYREFVSPNVQLQDLFDANGQYNRLNKWNTTSGIMHLNQRNNTLGAEINIAAFATILRKDGGQLLTDADELIRCARYGAPGRASDPRIGAEVNELARSGSAITLLNPVGLYIDSLNTTGWVTPNGKAAAEFWKPIRGKAGMIVRANFEVPSAEGYTVSDIKIGNDNIEFGGQIAEFITVKLTGVACKKGHFNNQPLGCVGGAAPLVVPAAAVAAHAKKATRY
jgi:hypothetical protein